MKTCLHRLCGDCKNCKEDYEPISPSHPVNNYNCRSYYEVNILTHEVIEEEKEMEKIKVYGI